MVIDRGLQKVPMNCVRSIPLKKLAVGVTTLDFSDHPPAELHFLSDHPPAKSQFFLDHPPTEFSSYAIFYGGSDHTTDPQNRKSFLDHPPTKPQIFPDHPPAEFFRGVVTPSTNFFNGIALSISVVVMQKKDLMGISAVYSSFGMTLTVKQSVQTTDYNSILGVIPKKVC